MDKASISKSNLGVNIGLDGLELLHYLSLLQRHAEVVDSVVVRHLFASFDGSLCHHQHLVAIDTESLCVSVARVVEEEESWEEGGPNLLDFWR